MTEPTGARMQHDVGADFKVPQLMFSGRNDDWLVRSARFGAYAELAAWTGVLEVAAAQTAPIVRITVFGSAIVIDVIVHCHTAGAL